MKIIERFAMKQFLWILQLAFWLKHYGYCNGFKQAWQYANEADWLIYYPDYSPRETVIEDLTYQ